MLLRQELASRGVGVAIVLHICRSRLRFADEVVMLDSGGSVHSYGATGEVLTPAALRAIFEVEFEQLNDARGMPAAFVPTAG